MGNPRPHPPSRHRHHPNRVLHTHPAPLLLLLHPLAQDRPTLHQRRLATQTPRPGTPPPPTTPHPPAAARRTHPRPARHPPARHIPVRHRTTTSRGTDPHQDRPAAAP